MDPLLNKIIGAGRDKDHFIISYRYVDKPQEEIKQLEMEMPDPFFIRQYVEEIIEARKWKLHDVIEEILFMEECNALPAIDPDKVCVKDWDVSTGKEVEVVEDLLFKNKTVPVEYYIILVSDI